MHSIKGVANSSFLHCASIIMTAYLATTLVIIQRTKRSAFLRTRESYDLSLIL